MKKQTEALKMAIEALSQDEGWFEPEAAIKACKEALEQPAPSWQGLSDDEMMEIWFSDKVESTLDFGRAIEQALKEKNNG